MNRGTGSSVAMNPETLHQLIAAQSCSAGLGGDACTRLARTASCHALAPGQFLFRQHEPAAQFFVVAAGSIKLYRMSPAGQEKVVAQVATGDSFAEGVLFMDAPRYPVHAQAIEASHVIGLSAATYRDILLSSPETCLALMGRLSGRIGRLLDEIESLTLQNSRDRVIHFLHGLLPPDAADNTVITLPARKETIAAQLSIRPETLSRVLSGLVRDGLVARTASSATFRIPAPDVLRRQIPNAGV